MSADTTPDVEIDEPSHDEEENGSSEDLPESHPSFASRHAGKIVAGVAVLAIGAGLVALIATAAEKPRGAVGKSPIGRVYRAVVPRPSIWARLIKVGGWMFSLLSFEPVREIVGHWLHGVARRMDAMATSSPAKKVPRGRRTDSKKVRGSDERPAKSEIDGVHGDEAVATHV